MARIRKYPSARAAALSGDNIPLSVYDNLVKIVNENLPTLHRYIETRKTPSGPRRTEDVRRLCASDRYAQAHHPV
ncbi:MAG: M3 family metallopeptidase [Anaerovoracaceae bacterium]